MGRQQKKNRSTGPGSPQALPPGDPQAEAPPPAQQTTEPPPATTDEASEDRDARGREDDLRTQAALERFVAKSNAEIHGLFEILGRKRRLLAVNFLAGLSRGVGFFLGMTIIGGLVVGLIAMTVDSTMRVLSIEDVTFRSLTEMLARHAVQAEQVWQDAREDEKERLAVEQADEVFDELLGETDPAAGDDPTPDEEAGSPETDPAEDLPPPEEEGEDG